MLKQDGLLVLFKCKFFLQNLTQERFGSVGFGIGEKVLRITFLNEHSLIHEDNFISYFTGKAHLVGNYNHGHTVFCNGLHYV